jgi:GGDEF domain-containing protein
MSFFRKSAAPVMVPREKRVHGAEKDAIAMSLAKSTVAGLMSDLDMGLWAVSRIADERYTLLASESRAWQLKDGDSFAADSTICNRMVAGRGPTVAQRISDVPAYAEAPQARDLSAASYVGVPILARGRLMGSLSAVGNHTIANEIYSPGELRQRVMKQASALGHVFEGVLDGHQLDRENDWDDALRSGDQLTQLPDRRGWAMLLDSEDRRAGRFADTVGVVVVDLGPTATAKRLRRDVALVREQAGAGAFVTRIGGRQLGLILPERTAVQVEVFTTELRMALAATGAQPSIGWSMRDPIDGLQGAWNRATTHAFVARRAYLIETA